MQPHRIFLALTLVGALSLTLPPVGPSLAQPTAEADSLAVFDHEVDVPRAGSALPTAMFQAAAAPGEQLISVLVVYSDDVRAAVGSGPQVRTIVEGFVAEANTALANSGADARVSLAATVEAQYSEPKSSIATLDNATLIDGELDQIPSLRAQYSADLVLLMVEDITDGGGIAWIGPDPTASVAVMERGCGGLCFAHELGHLFGSAHDPANAATPGHTPYSYGLQDPGYFRTVMAYPCGGSCPPIPYFSNPDVSYSGRPTGVYGAQDNVRSMNEVSASMAQFGNDTPTFGSMAIELTEISGSEVSITWEAASGNTSGYAVRVVDLTVGFWYDLVVGGTSASVTGLVEGRNYSLEVIAWSDTHKASLSGPTLLWTKGQAPPTTTTTTTTTTTAPPPELLGGFSDIGSSAFINEILWLSNQAITQGCAPDKFCPQNTVTRGEMAAFLRRALDLPFTGANTFGDDNGHIFEPDIEAVAAAGITLGCGQGLFCPDAQVTREQMAAFLTRALNLPTVSADSFSDDDGSVLEPDIESLAGAHITEGCSPGRFCPTDPVTREQMAAFLYRALAG